MILIISLDNHSIKFNQDTYHDIKYYAGLASLIAVKIWTFCTTYVILNNAC